MRHDKKPLLIAGAIGLALYWWSQSTAAAAAPADSVDTSGGDGTGFDPTIFGGDSGGGFAPAPATVPATTIAPNNTNQTGAGFDPQTGVYGDTSTPAPSTTSSGIIPGLFTAQADTFVSPTALTTSPAGTPDTFGSTPGPSFTYTDPPAQAPVFVTPSAASPIPTAAPGFITPYTPSVIAPNVTYIPPTSDYLQVPVSALDNPVNNASPAAVASVFVESHPLVKGLLSADAVTGVVDAAVNQSSFATPTFETLPADLVPVPDATDRSGTTRRINTL